MRGAFRRPDINQGRLVFGVWFKLDGRGSGYLNNGRFVDHGTSLETLYAYARASSHEPAAQTPKHPKSAAVPII